MKQWITVFVCLPLLAACATTGSGNGSAGEPATANQPGQAFWEALKPHCGQAFSGRVASAPAGDSAWQNATIRVHIRHCGTSRLLMPLNVDGDRSRTWIVARHPWGVTLTHAHRHSDGTADRVSNYGGLATPPASGTQLSFPVDDATRALLPRASGHEWRLALREDTLIYELQRAGEDRAFRLEFDLSEPVSPPPPPYGWEELLESRFIEPE